MIIVLLGSLSAKQRPAAYAERTRPRVYHFGAAGRGLRGLERLADTVRTAVRPVPPPAERHLRRERVRIQVLPEMPRAARRSRARRPRSPRLRGRPVRFRALEQSRSGRRSDRGAGRTRDPREKPRLSADVVRPRRRIPRAERDAGAG